MLEGFWDGGKKKVLRHLASYMRSIEWWTLEPHHELLRVEGRPTEVESLADPRPAASRVGLQVIYVPVGNERLSGRIEGKSWIVPVPDGQDWVYELKRAR